MYCENCGTKLKDGASFCSSCGASVQAVPVQQPVYTETPPPYAPPKKKRRIGCFVFLFLFVLVIGVGIFWVTGNITLIKPKDLGVRYTQKDYENAVKKANLSISFDGKTGDRLEKHKKAAKGKKLAINDYQWEFSDVKRETVTLTPSEASALLNNIAPSFWWFDQVQVNVLPDGMLEGSSRLDFFGLLKDVFGGDIEYVLADIDLPDIMPTKIPDILRTKINIYSKGKFYIKDNQIHADPESFRVGPIDLIKDVLQSEEDIREMEEALSFIYEIVPNLTIHSLSTDDNGNFVFDGTYPHSVIVKPKH